MLAKEPEAMMSYEYRGGKIRLQESAEGCGVCPCHGDQRQYSGSWRMQGLVFRYCAVNKMWGFLKHSVMLSDFLSRFKVLI